MSFGDFLQRKADDSTHNEILSFLTVILGAVLLMGGLLITSMAVEQTQWFLLLPYQLSSHPSAFLGLILTSTGFILIIVGFVSVIYYDRRKAWCLSQIQKAHPYKDDARTQLQLERIRRILEQPEPERSKV
jgi:heme/copper-type cytochrome/quinol oxidase subunit 1